MLAIYTPFGWLCWNVFVDVTIRSAKFIDYMENTLQPFLRAGTYGLLDNACIHETPEAFASIETASTSSARPTPTRTCQSRWALPMSSSFCATTKTRPSFSPCTVSTRHFSGTVYSIRGYSGLVAYNQFASYTRYHEYYLDNL